MRVTVPEHDARPNGTAGWIFGTGTGTGFGRTRRENVIKPCRALSHRYPVNCIVMRPERHGNVANPASQHHGRSAEAGGKATEAAARGEAAKAGAGGNRGCISLDTANRSNAGACARFSDGEDCRA